MAKILVRDEMELTENLETLKGEGYKIEDWMKAQLEDELELFDIILEVDETAGEITYDIVIDREVQTV